MKYALAELKRLNKPISAYYISKLTGMSRNTAIKYLKHENLSKYYVASWSGGKDSTYMINELLKKGDQLDEIIFADTGYEFPQMYIYIEKMENYWRNRYPGIKITRLNWKKGKDIWHKWSNSKWTRGENKGRVRGFPFSLGMDWCTRELKILPQERYINSLGYGLVYNYIGIAHDEPKRVRTTGELYPLVEWKITEREVAESLLKNGLHNPLYNHFGRTGCYLCPKQSVKALYRLWKHYPNLWSNIEAMQKKYKALGSSNWKIGYKSTDEHIKQFLEFDLKGEPTNYLDQNPIGCFCK